MSHGAGGATGLLLVASACGLLSDALALKVIDHVFGIAKARGATFPGGYCHGMSGIVDVAVRFGGKSLDVAFEAMEMVLNAPAGESSIPQTASCSGGQAPALLR